MASDKKLNGLSRRQLLASAAVVGSTVALPSFASASKPTPKQSSAPQTGPMPSRSNHTTTDLGTGYALIIGGFVGGRASRNTLMVELATGNWWTLAPMSTARARHAAICLADGRIVVMGGFDERFLSSVEVYDPALGYWRMLEPMSCARADFTAVASSNGIHLFGGNNDFTSPGEAIYALRSYSRNP